MVLFDLDQLDAWLESRAVPVAPAAGEGSR